MKKISKIVAIIIFFFQFSYSDSFEENINIARQNNFEIPQPEKKKIDTNIQKELFNFFSYFDNLFKAKEIKGEKYLSVSKSIEEKNILYSIDLKKILNEYLKSPITFKTSRGTTVHISGSKSSNCPDLSNKCKDKEKFFMILTTSANETFFIRAMEIINWSIFVSGSKSITIDGEKYTVKVYANASEPAKSILEVKGPNGIVIKSSLDKLGEAIAAKSIDIKLEKNYKLAYGNEIIQTGNGNAKFTQNKLLLFLPYPVQDAASYYLIKVSDIKPEGTLFPSMEPNYIFSVTNEVLKIARK